MTEPKDINSTPDLYRMVVEQNKLVSPGNAFDWELLQATTHLKSAIKIAGCDKAHLLQAALQITMGVRESD